MILSLDWQTRIRDWYWTDSTARARVGHVSSFGAVLDEGYLRALLVQPIQPAERFHDARFPPRQWLLCRPSRGGRAPELDEDDRAGAIDAFDECRQLARIWALLPQATREVLTRAYALDRPRPRDVFGPWGACAYLTDVADVLYARSRTARSLEAWLDALAEKCVLYGDEHDAERRAAQEKARGILVACELLVSRASDRFMDAVHMTHGGKAAA